MSAKNVEFLAGEQTELGLLCLRRRSLLSDPNTVVTEITLNSEFLMSSYNTVSERALARLAIEMSNASELEVLVGGLGLGYTAHEALASDRVAHVEVVEYLNPVITWIGQGLVPLADELKADIEGSRLTLIEGDVYDLLTSPPKRQWDLILIDVDHSPDEHLNFSNDSFYTSGSLRRAKQHLKKDGILAVWSYAESSPFSEALSEVFREVKVEPIAFHDDLGDQDVTDWLFFARD